MPTSILILIGLIIGGSSVAAFFVFMVLKPIWIKQGKKELLDSLRANDMKLRKKGKTIKFEDMTDEEYADYANSLVNNAQ